MGESALGRADLRVLVGAVMLFIELADATMILTACPSIGESFGISANAMSIGVTDYAAAVGLHPASGWAADRIGARRMLACAFDPADGDQRFGYLVSLPRNAGDNLRN